MQGENVPKDKNLTRCRFWGYILLCEDKIQIHVYGPDIWVADLVSSLKGFGVKVEEQFRSPCG